MLKRIKWTVSPAFFATLIGLTLVAFQNCSQTNFTPTNANESLSTSSTSPPAISGSISYAWVGNGWSSCSQVCGGGTQTQSFVCQRSDGQSVDNSLCPSPAPATSQACNSEACTNTMWIQSGFGACSVSCGGGTETQSVYCEDQGRNILPNSDCASPEPATSQSCNPQACVTYSWVQGGYGACSQVCGGGTQSQSVICQSSTGQTVDDSYCGSMTKPGASQSCNPQACLTYNWVQSGFGSCSTTCGGGTQTQSVSCQASNGQTVDNSNCTGAMPATSQACNTKACDVYSWLQSGWSACSVNCGGGTQTQSVSCEDVTSGQPVSNTNCTSAMPAESQSCNTQACSCTTTLNETSVPTKMLFIVDVSGSGATTDSGRAMRDSSIQKFLSDYSSYTNFSWSFLTFNTAVTALVTSNGSAAFSTAAAMQTAVNTFAKGTDSGNTDYVKPLTTATQMIKADPALNSSSNPPQYIVVFLSDGQPNTETSTDPTGLVKALVALSPGRISFNAIYYGQVDATASNLMNSMATAGSGTFLNTNTNPTGKDFVISSIISVPVTTCQSPN